ncbi:MAG: hypothetical protein IJA69_04110 [Clostridia bacterium]|nr:hypothetical protein [Clostridia bacterium]
MPRKIYPSHMEQSEQKIQSFAKVFDMIINKEINKNSEQLLDYVCDFEDHDRMSSLTLCAGSKSFVVINAYRPLDFSILTRVKIQFENDIKTIALRNVNFNDVRTLAMLLEYCNDNQLDFFANELMRKVKDNILDIQASETNCINFDLEKYIPKQTLEELNNNCKQIAKAICQSEEFEQI